MPIFVDLYLLPLEWYGIVLYTQLLHTFGSILWDFDKLQMSFKVTEQEVVIQGLFTPKNRLIGELRSNELRKSKKEVKLKFFTTRVPVPKLHSECNPLWQQLLDNFLDVFIEPKSLPPPRSHNHKIPLQNGVEPICIKHYSYLYY